MCPPLVLELSFTVPKSCPSLAKLKCLGKARDFSLFGFVGLCVVKVCPVLGS